jgi:hypothetical protein
LLFLAQPGGGALLFKEKLIGCRTRGIIKAFFASRFGTGKGVRPATGKEKVLVVMRKLSL